VLSEGSKGNLFPLQIPFLSVNQSFELITMIILIERFDILEFVFFEQKQVFKNQKINTQIKIDL